MSHLDHLSVTFASVCVAELRQAGRQAAMAISVSSSFAMATPPLSLSERNVSCNITTSLSLAAFEKHVCVAAKTINSSLMFGCV